MFPWESPKRRQKPKKQPKKPNRKATIKKYPLIGESGRSVKTVSGGGFETNRRKH